GVGAVAGPAHRGRIVLRRSLLAGGGGGGGGVVGVGPHRDGPRGHRAAGVVNRGRGVHGHLRERDPGPTRGGVEAAVAGGGHVGDVGGGDAEVAADGHGRGPGNVAVGGAG